MTIGIAIIHLGRCGSTVLGDMLNQNSKVTWYGEIIEPLLQATSRRNDADFVLSGDPAEMVNDILNDSPTDFAGVEFKPFHFEAFRISIPDFLATLGRIGIKHFVVLDRRNRLRKVVSSRLAARTGVWHVPATTSKLSYCFNLDFEYLVMDRKRGNLAELLDLYDTEFAEVRRALSPDYLDLFYEDDIETDPTIAYTKVVEYVGLPNERVSVTLGRTTVGSLRHVLQNYDAVAQHLASTKHAWMLDD